MVNQDYENLEAKPLDEGTKLLVKVKYSRTPPFPHNTGFSTTSPVPHGSRDYVNLEDQDYEDTATTNECVYEDYVPRPSAAPISQPPQAPISGQHGKGVFT